MCTHTCPSNWPFSAAYVAPQRRQVICRGCGQNAHESDLIAHVCDDCTRALLAGHETPSGMILIDDMEVNYGNSQ